MSAVLVLRWTCSVNGNYVEGDMFSVNETCVEVDMFSVNDTCVEVGHVQCLRYLC